MRNRILNILALSLPVQLLLVAWAAAHPQAVERWYSQGLYPYLSGFSRTLYGVFPFSIGDLAYLGLLAYGIYLLVRKGRRIRTHFRATLRNILAALSVLYFTFYLMWGLNYFRTPLAQAMGWEEAFTVEELQAVTRQLVGQANTLQQELAGDTLSAVVPPYTRQQIQALTVEGYRHLEARYPNLAYRHPSLKPSLISGWLSYMGYGGYLNPFTGEAQVNARLPLFRYPVVCGHEVGHQLGYSAENETNFIGYLVSLEHPDPYFRYSAVTSALGYCLAELGRQNPEEAKAIRAALHPGVEANYQQARDFWAGYANPLEPVFKAVFNTYLEANRQKDGIRSYSRVVSLLVGFHREHPLPEF
ncbi:DUF3810 domain-containing protein [Robiginitalea sp. M366]|uniref:DUF3810 domain-containing protein n=1 Tax=Robiginitalea aestuariiviva TaxID=3036903 RepID=UPI00240D4414|nr:DUF3810 domain-containing protein [Robiginitalea aestuariiviva]MDG1573234.1 DUF3810 domain-containing protein [Robiginitalea aestuariiviva]